MWSRRNEGQPGGGQARAVAAVGVVLLALLSVAGPAWAQSPSASAALPSASPVASVAAPPSVEPLPSPASDALRIVTTTSVFADIVRNVAREHAAVVSIVPPGVGPEDYEPTPADAQLLTDADLIVSNGAGLDDFLQDLLQSGTGGQTPQLVLGEGITSIDVEGKPNPHFWLDPLLVSNDYVPEIAAKLSEIDPAHALDYGIYGAAYQDSLTALDGYLQSVVAGVPAEDRQIVTLHDAFPYLARHFGFDVVGVILENGDTEPSAAQLAKLVDTVKAAGVNAVFAERGFNQELAQTLAQEAGVGQVVTLDTDSLGDPPADTYMGLIRADVERIAQALTASSSPAA
jgi:ABC-type Zn uptake system ZnuABC Zn-binding protein ZnuA